jgi:hypothetical protein
MMYGAGAIEVPGRTTILVPVLNITQVPFTRHRKVHRLNAMDRVESDRHVLHSQARFIVTSGIPHHIATLITTASCFANDGLHCSGIDTMTMPSYAV